MTFRKEKSLAQEMFVSEMGYKQDIDPAMTIMMNVDEIDVPVTPLKSVDSVEDRNKEKTATQPIEMPIHKKQPPHKDGSRSNENKTLPTATFFGQMSSLKFKNGTIKTFRAYQKMLSIKEGRNIGNNELLETLLSEKIKGLPGEWKNIFNVVSSIDK